MTTIITRQYADPAAARGLESLLRRKGMPKYAMQVLVKKEGQTEARLAELLKYAQVHESAMASYTKGLMAGNAVFVARARYTPLSAAQLVRDCIADTSPVATGSETDEFYVKDDLKDRRSILRDHPRFLTANTATISRTTDPNATSFGIKMLSKRKSADSAISGGRFMSRMFWPMPLLSKKKRSANSAISGGRHMSKAFWPAPLLSTKERRLSVIDGNPLSNALGWSTTT